MLAADSCGDSLRVCNRAESLEVYTVCERPSCELGGGQVLGRCLPGVDVHCHRVSEAAAAQQQRQSAAGQAVRAYVRCTNLQLLYESRCRGSSRTKVAGSGDAKTPLQNAPKQAAVLKYAKKRRAETR